MAYYSKAYAEAMAIKTSVSYTPYATSSKEQTGDIITFVQFEEGNLLSEYCNDTERGKKYYDNSTLASLISEGKIDVMSSGN